MSPNLSHDPHHAPKPVRQRLSLSLSSELTLIILIKLVALWMLWALTRSA